ncbi:Ig-like domain-containing protein [[Flexibacter] sp. ATCC 35208]|uniref:Ig-like domain-containing protein n=1 Tax=[Flexibacter] sp. ATCC 35208 TaxID=1936242 RepID=UPI0015C2E9CB|nr:Ig-like domain-containing protein [[Flexibacter] sp. ATCC 35208]
MKTPMCMLECLILTPMLLLAQQKLVWEENFDGTTLNPLNWTYETGDGCSKGNCGWGNAELEYYTSSTNNVRVENGHLVIEARREAVGGKPFTSGRIKTNGRVAFRYGTLEARIKVPQVGNGLWPAFWMLGSTGGEWPHNGEVDILEMGFAGAIAAGKPNSTLSSATHWWTENPGGYTGHATYAKDTVTQGTNLNDDYHLYKLVWDTAFLTIYLDGNPFYKIGINGGNGLDAFQQPFYILLNLAVGGNYPGIYSENDVTAPLPGHMEVDYIRLYQDITKGDELILGTNDAPEGNFGIFTDNTVVNNQVTLGKDANLYYWNNITNIPNPVPFEGSHVWGLHAAAGNWFGLGVANDNRNMANYATSGSLKFHMKTSYTGTFKVGISTEAAEGWIQFNGTNEHGLVRDGQWHEVTIPVSDFGTAIDLMTVNQLFMLSGDAPATDADFYIDNIYYTGGVSDNPAPTVAITNLSNDTLFTTPAAIPIITNANDSNGGVSKVDFYNGENYLGTDSIAPFSFTWQTSTQQVATLIAKATDNQQKLTTSQPVTVFIAAPGNTQPAISITAPTANSALIQPADVTITTAISDDGTIYKVEFYNGTTLLGTVDKAPYSFTWSDVAQGTYTITAKAFDNGKLSTLSVPVTFTVQSNVITADKYGIYSNDAGIATKLTFGQDANLYVWNNLTTISNATPYEGSDVMAFTAAAGNWFGLGVANDLRDLSHFTNGYLKFWFKTSYSGSFRFTIIASNASAAIEYAAGEQKLGLIRDGQWHEVTIPVSSLSGIDLTAITQAFTFSGDAPATAADFYIDNVYYTTTENEVSGDNLALNKQVTVSSLENDLYTGANAVDGDTTTRWSSTFADPQYITVDLAADYNIREVKIKWEAAAAQNYLVLASTDLNNWDTIKTVTGNSTLNNDLTGLSGHGRYLRVYGTSRITVYGYSIYELEVYGSLHTASALTYSKATTAWQVSIYPNPVTGDQLQVKSTQLPKLLRVMDVNGKVVAVKQQTFTADVSQLPNGMYILQVINDKGETRILKFIRQ